MSSLTPRAPKTQSEICAAARACTDAGTALDLIHTALDYHGIAVHARSQELVSLIDVYTRLVLQQHKTQSDSIGHLMGIIADQRAQIEQSAVLEFEDKSEQGSIFDRQPTDAEVEILFSSDERPIAHLHS